MRNFTSTSQTPDASCNRTNKHFLLTYDDFGTRIHLPTQFDTEISRSGQSLPIAPCNCSGAKT